MTAGTNANPVVTLYNECLASEKQWNRGKLEQLKNLMIRTLAFQGPVFTAFSGKGTSSDQELAARYRVLVSFLSAAKSGDQRQQIIAQWFWAALDIPPEDVLDRAVLRRLTAKDAKRVGKLKLNDFRYAGLVQAWLPYSENLLKDVKALSGKEFLARGYDAQAVELVNRKEWQSAIGLTCEWLARRGGIEMVKPREDPEVARTMRNAYSRVLGQHARRRRKATSTTG